MLHYPPAWRNRARQCAIWSMAAVVGLAILAAGCARPSPQEYQGASQRQPTMVNIGVRDVGRTVELAVGDRLVVVLPPAGPPGSDPWTLTYPIELLASVGGGQSSQRRELVARATGTGRIVISAPWSCRQREEPCPLADSAISPERRIVSRTSRFPITILIR